MDLETAMQPAGSYADGRLLAGRIGQVGVLLFNHPADLVAPADQVVEEALALARTIAGNAPLSVQAAKFTIDQILKDPADRDPAAVAGLARRCFDSADYKEGRTAFMEKREPVFTGR